MPAPDEVDAAAAAGGALVAVLTAKEAECRVYDLVRNVSGEVTHYLRNPDKVDDRTASAWQILIHINGRIGRDGTKIRVTFKEPSMIVTKDSNHFTVLSGDGTDSDKMIIQASEPSRGPKVSRYHHRRSREDPGRRTV